jgi:hypothetical protein
MAELLPEVLLEEYRTLVAEAGDDMRDAALIGSLVHEAGWTDRGAREVLGLARRYGTSILRNALALAAAMEIEDGESGL